MKKSHLLLQYLAIVAFFISALFYIGCTKDGPTGPAGTDGTDGVDGVDGTDGTDGTATCIACHNDSPLIKDAVDQFNLLAKITSEGVLVDIQNKVGHANVISFAGARNDCSGCHSHESGKLYLRN